MPESTDDTAPKKSRRGGAKKPLPVASVEYPATKGLLYQLRQDISGQQTDNRLLQSQHDDGISYVAINALMTALRSSTVQVNKERKPIALDSLRRGLVTKALPTPGGHSEDNEWVPHPDKDHALVKLIARPNPTETINDLMAQIIQQIMLTGSALLWANPNEYGLPTEMYVLPTALCLAQPPSQMYPKGYYTVTSYYPAGAFGILPYPGAGGGVPIDARQVFKIRQNHPLFRWDALSPLTAGAVQLSILEAIDQARFSAMENGLTTDAFILAPGQSQDQLNAWLEQLRQNNTGKRNHRKITALGGEVGSDQAKFDVKFPNASAKDMDYSGGWDQMTAFALALFGVPKAVAGLSPTGSYAELYAALKQFYTLTLQPWAARIGQWFTHNLAHIWGDDLAIQIDVPKINDDELIERQISTDTQSSAITVNEIRALRGRKPFEDGDVIPSVYAAVQQQKAQPQPAPGAPAPDGAAAPAADGAEQPAQSQAEGAADPLAALVGDEGATEAAVPTDENDDENANSDSTEEDVTTAALAALGVGANDDSDEAEPVNRIEKYLSPLHEKAGVVVTKPTKAKHQEGQKFESSGKWFVIKGGKAVPTSAPTSAKPDAKSAASASPVAPSPAIDHDAAAKAILGGNNFVRQYIGNKPVEIKDGASLKAFLQQGGELSNEAQLRLKVAGIDLPAPASAAVPASAPKLAPPTPAETAAIKSTGTVPAKRIASAAASVKGATPAARQKLSSVRTWANRHADKHADRLAKHFGVSRAKAHAILVRAMEGIAAYALRTGKVAGVKISHKGKTATLAQKPPAAQPPKPSYNPNVSRTGTITGAPTLPRPKNKAGKGSLPPKLSHASRERGDARLNSQIKGLEHSYGCVLLRVPDDTAERVRRIAALIPDDDLAEDGREDDPHVTALFGLTSDDPEPIESALAAHAPVALSFGPYRLFRNDEHDVLYIAIESPSLRRLNSSLCSLPHESTHREYVPHMTVAYLKPGAGDYWLKHLGRFGGSATVPDAVFSDADGVETVIPFAGTEVEKAPMSALTETNGGAFVEPAGQAALIPLKRPRRMLGRRKRRALVCKAVLAELDSADVTVTGAPDFASMLRSFKPVASD